MFTPKGKFGWYELMTSDTKAAGNSTLMLSAGRPRKCPAPVASRTPPSILAASEWPAC